MADGDHNDNARNLRHIIGHSGSDPTGLRTELMAAGAEHRVLPSTVTEGTAADVAIELERQRRKVKHLLGNSEGGESTSQAQSRGLQPFARGMVVRHRKTGKTVTIVMASVGTSESGQPKHKVVFPDGETKNVPEGNLERF